MPFSLRRTTLAQRQYDALATDIAKLNKVNKTLGQIETNPRHPGLHSHKIDNMTGPNGEEIWESYVENRTPAAYRVFWHYGPGKSEITIVAITPHP